MERSGFDTLLAQSSLFAGLGVHGRDSLLRCFSPLAFDAGDPLIRAGDVGRTMGVVLTGRAVVQAREGDRAFTVERLEAGAVFGEMSFFDPEALRAADVIGDEPGVAALLPFAGYAALARDGSAGAAALEKNVLELLAKRVQSTDGRLAELLESTKQGTFMSTLRRFFGVRSS